MTSSNGSQPNLSNRRVRGAKPEGASTSSSENGLADQLRAAGLERRQAAIAARKNGAAPIADGDKTPIFQKKTKMQQRAAEEPGELESVANLPKKRRSAKDVQAEVARILREGIEADDALERVADEEDGDQEPGDSDREDGEEPQSQELEAIAEALGVEVSDLWESVTFRTKDGKTRKLGELKDVLQSTVDLDAREIEFGERKSSEENDLLRRRQELDFILRSLPKTAVTPELEARAVAERKRVIKLEAERTLEAIPDWKKEEVRTKERAAIGQWMTQYGFSPSDVDRLLDHRMLKLLRDSWQRYERVTKALAKVKEQKNDGGTKPARSNQGRRPSVPKLGPNATTTERVAAVAAILRGSSSSTSH